MKKLKFVKALIFALCTIFITGCANDSSDPTFIASTPAASTTSDSTEKAVKTETIESISTSGTEAVTDDGKVKFAQADGSYYLFAQTGVTQNSGRTLLQSVTEGGTWEFYDVNGIKKYSGSFTGNAKTGTSAISMTILKAVTAKGQEGTVTGATTFVFNLSGNDGARTFTAEIPAVTVTVVIDAPVVTPVSKPADPSTLWRHIADENCTDNTIAFDITNVANVSFTENFDSEDVSAYSDTKIERYFDVKADRKYRISWKTSAPANSSIYPMGFIRDDVQECDWIYNKDEYYYKNGLSTYDLYADRIYLRNNSETYSFVYGFRVTERICLVFKTPKVSGEYKISDFKIEEIGAYSYKPADGKVNHWTYEVCTGVDEVTSCSRPSESEISLTLKAEKENGDSGHVSFYKYITTKKDKVYKISWKCSYPEGSFLRPSGDWSNTVWNATHSWEAAWKANLVAFDSETNTYYMFYPAVRDDGFDDNHSLDVHFNIGCISGEYKVYDFKNEELGDRYGWNFDVGGDSSQSITSFEPSEDGLKVRLTFYNNSDNSYSYMHFTKSISVKSGKKYKVSWKAPMTGNKNVFQTASITIINSDYSKSSLGNDVQMLVQDGTTSLEFTAPYTTDDLRISFDNPLCLTGNYEIKDFYVKEVQ